MTIFSALGVFGTEHAEKLVSALIDGLSSFLTLYLPMILGFSLLLQQDKIGKTLVGWLRWFATLHLRRLRRVSRDAETLTLFWFMSIKLRPTARTRPRRRAIESKSAIQEIDPKPPIDPVDRGQAAA